MLTPQEVFALAQTSGMTYEHFLTQMTINAQLANNPSASLTQDVLDHLPHIPLNLTRTNRIAKSYTVSDALRTALAQIAQPQTWVVITEDWCGDSAQNLPHLVKMVECTSHLDIRILLRDMHPQAIDTYLTNGTRSIPILIAFDYQGNQLFRWGPRPAEAQEVMLAKKAEGVARETMIEAIHVWYSKNRGKALEQEMLALLAPFAHESLSI